MVATPTRQVKPLTSDKRREVQKAFRLPAFIASPGGISYDPASTSDRPMSDRQGGRTMAYKIMIMGASYGSLLASKILFGGHSVHLITASPPRPT
jgi:hypothetical protein